ECVWSVLSLIGKLVGRSAESLGVQRVEVFPLQDGPGDDLARFARAVDLLARLVEEGPPVFVHCRAGQSRSAAVVAAFLMRSRGAERGAGGGSGRVPAGHRAKPRDGRAGPAVRGI